jgi:ATP-dependent DNA helicase
MEGTEKESELEKPVVAEGEGDEDEDTEGLDMKARALNKLLQTSSVSLIDSLYGVLFG